jgi:hypothetical protein
MGISQHPPWFRAQERWVGSAEKSSEDITCSLHLSYFLNFYVNCALARHDVQIICRYHQAGIGCMPITLFTHNSADAFCRKYVKPAKHKQRRDATHAQSGCATTHSRPQPGKFYRPRDHEASPFFKIVRDYFDEFEKVYPERYQERYGYWRSVIRSSIKKFQKCGDLKDGFARVLCPECKEEFFVAFSCRQRLCCQS